MTDPNTPEHPAWTEGPVTTDAGFSTERIHFEARVIGEGQQTGLKGVG